MIKEIHRRLREKELSVEELTKGYLESINSKDKKLNAFITITEEKALETSRLLDSTIAKIGFEQALKTHRLLGIPVGLKDIYSTAGIETTAGSDILKGYIPPYDATVVSKIKSDGAVILGKLNCDAFAHGTSGENSDFGPSKNPYDLTRVSGGSSSGSGVAVQSDMCVVATGTDTGGSIRNPASFTNTVSIKPTYGLVSRYGIIAMASSLDSIGHITLNIADSAYFLSSTAGYDPKDLTTSVNEIPDYSKNLGKDIKGLKIGVPDEYVSEGINLEIKAKVEEASNVFTKLGAEIVKVKLPHTEYALAVYYIIVPSEVSSNLARFDGIRFGHSRETFGDEAKRRIMIGTYTLSSGYYDQYYLKAQKVRTLVIKDFEDAFKKVDILLGPVSPVLPPKIGENVNDPLKMYLMDALTVPINLAGLPALSVPAGFSKSGLPIGIQLIGPHFSETLLFQAGHAFEQETKYFEKRSFNDKSL